MATTMKIILRHNRIFALFLGLALFAFAGWASADPPTRVARLGYLAGGVSLSPAGENDWMWAVMNQPLVSGDRLWADADGRAELQVGAVVMRMNGGTSLSVLNLDDNVVQLQLTQGTINLHVWRFGPNDVIEVDTPNLAFSIRQPGDYRIDVDAASDATTVATHSGRADVYGEDAAYSIDAQRSYSFYGTGLRDYDVLDLQPADDFDRWSDDRDRLRERSVSARYVSPDVIGYQDLDDNGTWQFDPAYGNVWIPNRVPVGWAPYQYGHWTWVDPWGWTWVDDAPWGFAVSHYGRWTYLGGAWGWVPGPVRARAVYAPALVAFVDDGDSRHRGRKDGGIGWFPLGPRDVYRPAYKVSRGYFTSINTSNTIITSTHITNVYNDTRVTNITYVNQRVAGAVIVVPETAFTQSRPVSKARMRMPKEQLAHAQVMPVAAVVPVRTSVMGSENPAGSKPPERVLERPVFAKRTPPPAAVSFARKQHLFATHPGKPLDDATLQTLQPAAPAQAEKFKMIAPMPAAAPNEQRREFRQRVQPPVPEVQPQAAPAPAATPNEQRVQPQAPEVQPQTAPAPAAMPNEQRRGFQRRPQPPVPEAQPQAAPAPAATPNEQRRKFEQRVRPQAPEVQPQVVPAPAVMPDGQPQTAQSPSNEPTGKSEKRGNEPGADAAKNKKLKRNKPLTSEEQLQLEEQQRQDEAEKKKYPLRQNAP